MEREAKKLEFKRGDFILCLHGYRSQFYYALNSESTLHISHSWYFNDDWVKRDGLQLNEIYKHAVSSRNFFDDTASIIPFEFLPGDVKSAYDNIFKLLIEPNIV